MKEKKGKQVFCKCPVSGIPFAFWGLIFLLLRQWDWTIVLRPLQLSDCMTPKFSVGYGNKTVFREKTGFVLEKSHYI